MTILSHRENPRQIRNRLRAQERLPTATATGLFLSPTAGNGVAWNAIPTATAVAMATQPAVSLLYTVTATATAIDLSWASVATQYRNIRASFNEVRTASIAAVAILCSTDGVTFDTATTAYKWLTAIARSNTGQAADAFGVDAFDTASHGVISAGSTDFMVAAQFSGFAEIFPNNHAAAGTPVVNTEIQYLGNSAGGTSTSMVNTDGSVFFLGGAGLKGIRVHIVAGTASFTDGEVILWGLA